MTSVTAFSMFFHSNLANRVLGDTILPGIGLIFGLPVFVLLVFGEGFLISKILRIRYRLAIKFTFWANIISALLGNPFFLIYPLLPNEFYMSFMVPAGLYEYCKSFLYYSVLAYLVYLFLTVITEWLYALWWRKKGRFVSGKGVLLYAVGLANIVGYSILCPVHYYFSSPSRHISEVTEDSSWARQPCEPILYVGNNDCHLMKVDSSGANSEVLVPYPVKHYLCSKDLIKFVFFESRGELYHYNRQTQVLSELWKSSRSISQLNTVREVALSPSGNRAAWIVKTAKGHSPRGAWEPNHWRLFFTNLGTHRTSTFDYRATGGQVAWSNNESVIYLRCPAVSYHEAVRGIVRIKLGSDESISIEGNVEKKEVDLCSNYGRVGDFYWSAGDTYVEHTTDEYEDLRAFTVKGLGSHIRITKNGKTIFRFSDSPFIIPIARRSITEAFFINEGHECIFEYSDSLFLLDIEGRKLGKIVDGKDAVVLRESCRKRKYFLSELD
ncbi:MAG: hypothetical protein ACYTBJ_20135 [Planctomycetota bacterium]|jgi:hypothetical protein